MPYNNFSFVIDSSFRPFSMQEMLTPLAMYKDAFEKTEEAYIDLSNRADKFKYLADTLDPDSKAAQIYNGYANDLKAQAEDLAHNGLSMANRRALTGLRRRYQGEIGRLVDADAKLQQEIQLRRQMATKDPTMLYATDNLNIDNYLDNNTPNLYSVSGNDLYARGAAAGKAASSRIYSAGDAGSTLGGMYRDYVQTNGYNPQTIAQFRQDMSAIPELQAQADAILQANGVYDNLKGRSLEQARQQVINGMIDGAVYTENHNPTRDLNVPTWSEKRQDARADAQMKMAMQDWYDHRNLTYELDENGNAIGYKSNTDIPGYARDPMTGKLVKVGTGTSSGSSGSRGGGSEYRTVNKGGLRLEWKGNNPNPTNGDADDDMSVTPLDKDEKKYVGLPKDYDDLPPFVQAKIDKAVGPNGDVDDYEYYYRPYKSSMWGDTEAAVDMIPRGLTKHNSVNDESEGQSFDIH